LVLTKEPHANHYGVVTLKEYLKQAEIDRHVFAERIGVSPETVRRYIAGDRIPDKQRMSRIALATHGQVTANDFFGLAA
jgi:DNA-binding transcriptional regulator YdaS (Cro superfamily)